MTACSTGGSALLQSVQYAGGHMLSGAGAGGLPERPDPRYSYLRVQLNDGPPAMLVLGYVDSHPMGPVEVWYSAKNEVLKLQHGRIVATQGLGLDWPAVRFATTPVPWVEVGADGAVFEREHDEAPGYRYGVREVVATRLWAQAPNLSGGATLNAAGAKRYRWYQESARQPGGLATISWFAWGAHLGSSTVVFSQQCLAPQFCLHIQRWPPDEGAL